MSVSISTVEVCSRCLMDSSALDWRATKSGCNYCDEFLIQLSKEKILTENEGHNSTKKNLEKFRNQIKKLNNGQNYDCILGLSGGVDSCYALHLIVELGLRPLVVHMDNGWDSELAQSNIENLLNKLDVDYVSYVLNWNEYRDMQLAFLKADVVDIEMLYDQAALSVCYLYARKHKVKTLIGGTNINTEGLRQPQEWSTLDKLDVKNIKGILKYFSPSHKYVNYPFYSTFDNIVDNFFRGIKWNSPLDLIDYNKEQAVKILTEKYEFKAYPYKHYESVFTRFYQGYILPNKFKIDKRKSHLSTLILTEQITRIQALELLKQNPYSDDAESNSDLEYVLKKLEITHAEFFEYMGRTPKSHLDYPNNRFFYTRAFLPLMAFSRFISKDITIRKKLLWLMRKLLKIN